VTDSTSLSSKTKPWCRLSVACAIGLLLFCLDFATKFWVDASIPLRATHPHFYPYGGVGVYRNFLGTEFSIVHAINLGAAWGAFADLQIPLLILRMTLVAVLIAFVFFWNRQPSWRIPLVLIIVGALGNIIDFFHYGHVVDMFSFVLWGYDYPVFNVADICIVSGISWLFLASFFEKKTA
jgi:signal peptidase II